MIRIKRVYDAAAPTDGTRILVDRLWPRGIAKSEARIDEWRSDVAPSHALRRRFHTHPDRWEEFLDSYRRELREAGKEEDLRTLSRRARGETLTLLFAARDAERNNAAALKILIRAFGAPGKEL